MVWAALLVSGLATGQPAPADSGVVTAPAPPAKVQQNKHMYRASKIIGTIVRDGQERRIGEIKELLLDARRGEVAYAVVNFGGTMGVGSTYHAIPWRALRPSDDGRYYVLQAGRDTISQAPGFDHGNWPDLADERWSADVDRYWSSRIGPDAAEVNRLPSAAPPAPGSR